MWVRMNQNGSNTELTDGRYSILNFTNLSDVGMARFWRSTTGWENLVTGLNYRAWNNFELEFNGEGVIARVNGTQVATHTLPTGATRMTDAFLQVQNFGEDNFTEQNFGVNIYNAYWSNATSVIPEPSTYALMATGLVGLVGLARRRNSKNLA